MRARFAALLATFGLATAGILTAGAQTGYADVFSTTGSATSVTSTSAILNGVSLTINPASAWVFQYGTSSAYGQYSHGSSVGVGLTAVSETVSNLTPNTAYQFRLVVRQGDPGNTGNYSAGGDVTFTTKPAAPAALTYGTTSVASHRLAVKHGTMSIRFLCNGKKGALCKGKVAVVARNQHGHLIGCGSGSLVTSSGHRHEIESALNGRCWTLLSKARTHTLSGEVRVTLAGTQQPLRSFVTLVGSILPTKTVRATIASAHQLPAHTRHTRVHIHRHHARRHARHARA